VARRPGGRCPRQPPTAFIELIAVTNQADAASWSWCDGWRRHSSRGFRRAVRDSMCTRLAGSFHRGSGINAETTNGILNDTFARACRPAFPLADVPEVQWGALRSVNSRGSLSRLMRSTSWPRKPPDVRLGHRIFGAGVLECPGGHPRSSRTAVSHPPGPRIFRHRNPVARLPNHPGRVLSSRPRLDEQHFKRGCAYESGPGSILALHAHLFALCLAALRYRQAPLEPLKVRPNRSS